MTHSVSHSLILEYNGNRLTILTQRKDDIILEVKEYQGVSVNTLKTILGNLPEVFSEIKCCIRNKEFILIPEEYFNEDHSEIFKLSYDLALNQNLFLDKLDHKIGVLYKNEVEIHNLFKAKFPRINIHHETTLILSKIYKEFNSSGSDVYLSVNEDSILLVCVKEKQLVLCNLYQAKTVHEIFYFVMLVYEQFHLNANEIGLTILGNPCNKAELYELLSQYIRSISFRNEELRFADGVSSAASLNQSFAMQLMVCE